VNDRPVCWVIRSSATLPRVTEQTGQRGEVETGTGSQDTNAETSQDEADELAGPNERSGYEGDSGSSSGGSDSSSSDSPSSASSSSSSNGQQSSTTSEDSDSGESRSSEEGHGSEEASPRGRRERTPVNIGELGWKIANVVASVVRVVAYVLAAVLVAFIVLTLVGVNTANGVAQVIGSVGNTAVFAFRDLFLLGDPTFTVIVDYGLAAVFWVLVAEFGSRLIRWLGARLS
jgi:hypothetical protein